MTTRLRDVLEGQKQAKAVDGEQRQKREEQRAHIRAKLSDRDRDFIDAIRDTFPGARLTGIKFKDGEVIGNP